MDERTAGVLRARAAQHEISMSEVVAQTLQEAVRDEAAEGVGTELLLPAVRATVRREVGRMSDRLSHLMARSALESAADRRALYQILVKEFGQEQAREINRRSWVQSVESLKRPAEGLREILGERAGDDLGSEDARSESMIRREREGSEDAEEGRPEGGEH